uniref:DNA-directed RNA polymerase subunit alpha n=1 Tax=Pityrogramma trifoliata TaxID=164275 RepID=A0A3G5CQW2_9MONI|nr:RNA polymerase alpha subunit [Pityrogramma trifoliata]AYW15257.1 RNA polymerase alpha subunit [Pityrogramma trifoliata]
MLKDERSISTQAIQWKCLDSKKESKRLHYGRFLLSSFKRGQASTVGIAMRRALLQEVAGTSITRAKFHGVVHEYSTITGLQETIHDALVNPKEIVLKSDFDDIQEGFLSVTGPKQVTAADILLPPGVKIIDNSQYVATITQPISSNIGLEFEKDCGYRIENSNGDKDGQFSINAVFMPVQNMNYSIHLLGSGRATREISFIEIWTNGSLTPHEALNEASKKLIEMSNPFLDIRCKDFFPLESKKDSINLTGSPLLRLQSDNASKLEITLLKDTFIDQLELPARAFNCLKRAEIHTIADLLNYSQEDLLKIRNFGQKSISEVSKALWERFAKELPNKNLGIN